MKPTEQEWRKVVEAIEQSLPVYDSVSEKISLNLASRARMRAVQYLTTRRSDWTLDLGVGPGTSTRMLLANSFGRVVGLEPSILLLKNANRNFRKGFYPVLGVSEQMPFKDGCLGSILTCFALRDVRDLKTSMDEISRTAGNRGRLGIVDIGKPESAIPRGFISFYVKHGMPLLSCLATRRRVKGNPFRMIVPTFNRLVSNEALLRMVGRVFGS
ncbi:MAG TPA: class I SAM-dependent methyltransferase, partial [Candidatus Binatus sp.]|nr:class I SAM-dependent methyltransferase [Candidatus Binatus sp.]